LGILNDAGGTAVADTGWIARIVAVDGEPMSIVPVEPILRAEPHEPLTVLKDAAHGALGKTVFDTQMLKAGDVALCGAHLEFLLVHSGRPALKHLVFLNLIGIALHLAARNRYDVHDQSH
jgi:hypothetical protein